MAIAPASGVELPRGAFRIAAELPRIGRPAQHSCGAPRLVDGGDVRAGVVRLGPASDVDVPVVRRRDERCDDYRGRERHRPHRQRELARAFPAADEQRAAAREAGERDRGHLPVPVDSRVKDESGVGPGRDCDERSPPHPAEGEERYPQHGRRKQQPERPELAEHLDVEAVRVERVVDRVPVSIPHERERPRS